MMLPVYGFSVLPGCVAFAHTKEQTLRFCKKNGFPKSDWEHCWPETRGKATTSYSTDSYDCIVALNMKLCRAGGLTKNQIRAILAHEAVHVAHHIFERIGEDVPGEESHAYLIQAITLFLLNQYDLVSKPKRKATK